MISKSQIRFVKQLELKKYRQRERLFVAEGPKVVGDLLTAGYLPKQLFATEEWGGISDRQTPLLEIVTSGELRKISFLQHPQQVLALFPVPDHPLPHPLSTSAPSLQIALDNIQDPGNLGTIIRIADWFGISQIVCSENTVDAWSPKVIQATMGSIARVNIVYTDLKYYLSHTTLPICGTLLDGEDIYQKQLPKEAVIVMGNEGNGISSDIRSLITHRLLIPRFQEGAESLNVAIATAITCSEFRRRS